MEKDVSMWLILRLKTVHVICGSSEAGSLEKASNTKSPPTAEIIEVQIKRGRGHKSNIVGLYI